MNTSNCLVGFQESIMGEVLVRIEDYYQMNNTLPERIIMHPIALQILKIEPNNLFKNLTVETSLEIQPFEVVVY